MWSNKYPCPTKKPPFRVVFSSYYPLFCSVLVASSSLASIQL